MHYSFTIVVVTYLLWIASITNCDKINLDTLNNYSEFLNFGEKKLSKLNRHQLENAIIKSKVDVLGEIFKKNIDAIKISSKLDLIFLIDASSSVGETNFNSEIKFVKKLLSDITVDFNHTRVAVITFGTSVNKNIDEISEPIKENNKCLLLNQQLTKIEYLGGGTYTLGAFQAAKDIFQYSRNDTKKVLFLITDGFSNGGDPVPLAAELKKKLITIFTIGIQSGNYKELYDLASSPGEFYSYLLDSFQEFESLARRALHVDLKSGDYIPLGINSPCDKLCDGGNCCDKNALCTCGTTTGHYSCVCQPGYYGSGLQNDCFLCPNGTYSNGPNLCLPCPDMHHVTRAPAKSVASCRCKDGYQATKKNQCEILKCPKISTPDHGYFVKKRDCGNVFNTACGIRCEVGYTLVGTSIRLCQSNASWSGDEPSCQVRTCSKLTLPQFGSMSCSHFDLGITYKENEQDLPVDTVCTFKCNDGKTLIGSSQRTCLPLAQWDGLKTSCKQIKCPKLPPVKNGKIEPKSCTIGKQSYGKKCKIICDAGFELEGPNEKVCTGRHGSWDSKYESSICKDLQAPNITCPKNVTTSTHLGQKYATVMWQQPLVKDNSELDVTVWMKPSIKNISNFKFEIGTTKVTYFAQDSYHNRAKCSFFITVKDYERPTIEDCVDPPVFLTTNKSGANVTWDEPNIFDNSQSVKIERSHAFGLFPIGTTVVSYMAIDPSGNKNVCYINISIEDAQCEALQDPIYGRSECASQSDGMQCIISCQEGYAVPLSQPESNLNDNSSVRFMCNNKSTDDSNWYNPEGLLFPECSVAEVPKDIEQNGTISISSAELDNCNNTEKLKELENDIKVSLRESSCGENCTVNTNTTCGDDDEDDDNKEEQSNIIKREIKYEEVPHRNTSRRRNKKKRVNVKFQVKGTYVNTTHAPPNITGFSIYYDKPKFICPLGFVPRKNRCVQCPKGTFYNQLHNKCQSCPFGTYNDLLGQIECKQCPPYHSTRKLHSKKADDCKQQCPPGTHARRKSRKQSKRLPNLTERATLWPYCRSCPIGTYQDSYGQMHCLECSLGYTTLTAKSYHISQCVVTSTEICSKSRGICNNGTCIPTNNLQYFCNCTENYIGTHCERKLSQCDSNPCLNRGICHESTNNNFTCTCPIGYSGKLCQDQEENCILKCLNHGTCYQSDDNDYFCICPPGYGGDSCEIKLSYCHHHNICENNSTCVEDANGYRCLCRNGFIGRRCNILPCDYKPCQGENTICVNVVEDVTTRTSFRCVCSEGYTGALCDQKINYCDDFKCENGGICHSNETGPYCKCSKLFQGFNCTKKRRTDYVLNFSKFSTSDYIKLNGFQEDLNAISACLWMVTQDNFNYGTLLSYATPKFDNAFTLTDYTGLVLYVNNHHIVTDLLLNDGLWHHICVTWTNGSYAMYIDGRLVRSGTGLAANTSIEGRGNLVIGQEQDVLGGRFSQSETFLGKIAYFDVWSKVLDLQDVQNHMNDCQDKIYGDIYAWAEISNNVQGNILVENSTFCQTCPDPKPLYNGVINIVDNVAFYECYKGFYMTNPLFSKGRKCTKAAKWEWAFEPFCRKINCGYPGYVRNAYIIGRNYDYLNQIAYECLDGYNLVGNSTIQCGENGRWYPERPRCIGAQCKAFKKPENANLTVIAEHSYEDFIENKSMFDIGTQVEIQCIGKAKLSGESVLTCQENGTWDVEPAICILEKAEEKIEQKNSEEQLREEKIEVKDKEETTTTPKSKHNHCAIDKVPPAPDNGYVDLESMHAFGNGTEQYVEYKCRTGYKLTGINYTTCIIDGYWTEPNVTCSPTYCPEPPLFKNMILKSEFHNKQFEFGQMVKFDCIDGYKMYADSTIRCTAKGKWTRQKAKCSRISCREPILHEDTVIEGDSYLFQDEVTILCKSAKSYILLCSSSGQWVGEKDSTC